MPKQRHARRHILVVEDDQAIAEMLKLLLELEGYRVTAVALGDQALDVLVAVLDRPPPERVDLIVLDLQLPDMDGTQIVAPLQELLREVPPVIVLSARPALAIEQAAASIHAASLLHKPFDIAELLAQIEAALSAPALADR